jgi:hypothetical protein
MRESFVRHVPQAPVETKFPQVPMIQDWTKEKNKIIKQRGTLEHKNTFTKNK